jgi:hypothetical protein
MNTLSIARRFCGPADSSNGGYFAGLVARLTSETLTVRLLKPPPLETDLQILELEGGAIQVRQGETLIGEARPTQLRFDLPPAASYFEAVEASRRYAGFVSHRFPTCFVCGTQRVRGDGMRIFAGPLEERGLVAAPWVPDASLDGGGGKVRPEFMSAALDCPGYYAIVASLQASPDRATRDGPRLDPMMLLGELTVHLDRLVHVGESCTVIGWARASNGRKHEAGTAILDEDGVPCARAHAVWIEPRTGS